MHPDFRELQSLVDEELDPLDRDEVNHHLDGCDRCRDAFEVLRCVAESLAAIPRIAAPRELPDRIMTACAEATPVPTIGCDTALAMASEYIDGELAGLQRDTLEAHLFSCEACYTAFRRMERTAELLRSTPAVPAPDGLHERIAAAVELDGAPAPVFTWRRTAGVVATVAAAAAVLFAVLAPRGIEQPTAPEPQVVAVHAEETAESVAEPVAEEEVAAPVEDAAEEAAAAGADTAEPPARTPGTPARPRPAAPPAERPSESVTPAPAPSEPAPAPRTVSPETRPDAEVAEADAAPAPHTDTPRAVPTDGVADPPSSTEPPRTPRESVIAREPGPGPLTQPVPPDPVVETPPAPAVDREDAHIAVVPVQSEARTLYRASEEPHMERIARATRAVNSDVGRAWTDMDTGMDLR